MFRKHGHLAVGDITHIKTLCLLFLFTQQRTFSTPLSFTCSKPNLLVVF